MVLPKDGHLLRLFVGEKDRHDSRLHKTGILRLSTDLPIVVEIVDTREKIEAFLPLLDGVIHEGLATLEKVEIRFYRSGKKES